MNERKTFKKRLARMFTMTLVLSMMLGITANAAGVNYWVKCDDGSGKHVLYSDAECTEGNKVPEDRVLNDGDIVTNAGGDDFYVSVSDGVWNEIDSDFFTIADGSYNYSLEEDVSGFCLCLTLVAQEAPEEDPVEMPEAVPQEAPQEAPVEEPVVINEKTHYGFFSEKVTQDIMNVAQGGTLEIKSEVWHTLTQNVMLALAQRRDINVIITLRYNHEDYQYIIPAGTSIDTADKYYGPLYLGQLYGMTKLEK